MKRRNMRTLTFKAAVARTGLPIERLRRAVRAGEIAVFREPVIPGHAPRSTFYLLESSLEAWFDARVSGGDVAAPAAADSDETAATEPFDVDEDLLKDIPQSERLFS